MVEINKILKILYDKKSRASNKLIEKHTSNLDFPFLISFPRTGSHWLRQLMELYLEKPALVRAFYFHNSKDFWAYHDHDFNLQLVRKNIIYLYRNPIDTVYSQLRFDNLKIDDRIQIKYLSTIYGLHLNKWIFEENFTTDKTIISYENLKKSPFEEFSKILSHLNIKPERRRFESILLQVSKQSLLKKTKHDNRVINTQINYENEREFFRKNFGDLVLESIKKVNPNLI